MGYSYWPSTTYHYWPQTYHYWPQTYFYWPIHGAAVHKLALCGPNDDDVLLIDEAGNIELEGPLEGTYFKDEDDMASDAADAAASQQSIKAYADTKLANLVEDTTPQFGGDVDLNAHNIDFPSVANISDVKDEDNMASDSATMLATQQSIKAYIDAQIATRIRIYTGSYTGDGATSQAITGVGFLPKYVRVWPKETVALTDTYIYETTAEILDDHASGGCIISYGGVVDFYINRIIALGADGFTVDDNGADEHPNKNTQVYNYMCLG